ncbi:hypothetical protein FOZ63_001988, partial [Perkinsus olseni]
MSQPLPASSARTAVQPSPSALKDANAQEDGGVRQGLDLTGDRGGINAKSNGRTMNSNGKEAAAGGSPTNDKISPKAGMNSTSNVSAAAAAAAMAKYYLLPGHQYNQEQLRNAVMLAAQIVEKQRQGSGKTMMEAKKTADVNSTDTSENST